MVVLGLDSANPYPPGWTLDNCDNLSRCGLCRWPKTLAYLGRAGVNGHLEFCVPSSPPATQRQAFPVPPVPTLTVAVQIERQRQPSRWEDWRFRITDVVLDEGQFGSQMRTLRDDGNTAITLHPGLPVSLHRDEAEGYYLNLSSGSPVWFVMWRVAEDDPSRAWPEFVTVSYHEAGRLLDAQERVDNVPLPADVRAALQSFADEHYKPEVKQRRRPASFRAPDKR